MPDGVGQVDHLTLEDRPQSPLPPAVVGDEPHGCREPKRTPAGSRNHVAEGRFFGLLQDRTRQDTFRRARIPCRATAHHEEHRSKGGAPPMAEKFRITYATLSADNEDLQKAYDEAAERMKGELGKEYPFVVNGEERWTEEKYEEPSPIDSDIVIGRFSQATAQDVNDAVAAAKGVLARMGSDGLAGAGAHPAKGRRHHGGAPVRPVGADGVRGRQEPARGARRRAGDRRARPLELRRDREARRVPDADVAASARPASTTT